MYTILRIQQLLDFLKRFIAGLNHKGIHVNGAKEADGCEEQAEATRPHSVEEWQEGEAHKEIENLKCEGGEWKNGFT